MLKHSLTLYYVYLPYSPAHCESHSNTLSFLSRFSSSQVAENNTTSAQNYNAAFLVNRRIANENTDALFRYVVVLF